jgi:Domain of unknown function (DUF4062)
MNPPSFFLSSTIYDFKDLRSAIKYYLEQQRCRVLASDFNDFPHPPDKHSYEACLKEIAEADFFVLLIGARVGGWYDEPNQVSITQQEYREAYKLHQAGKLKILSFVRADVWRMKDDRKALENHIQALGLDPGAKTQVLLTPTKAATNAEFVVRFIEEVGKSRETANAAKGKGSFPTGNWLHVFEDFSDIIEQLQVQAFSGRPVEEAAMRRLLRQELAEVLRHCLIGGGKHAAAFTAEVAVHNFYANLSEPFRLNKEDSTVVPTEQFATLLSLWTHIMITKLFVMILPEAAKSPTFMDFDRVSGGMVEQPMHKAIIRLLIELQNFKMKDSPEIPKLFLAEYPRGKNRQKTMLVNSMTLLMVLHSIDRWINITKLCKAIIKYLDGEDFVMPDLRPQSPAYEVGELEEKLPTREQLEEFITKPMRNLKDVRCIADMTAGGARPPSVPAKKPPRSKD